MKRYQSIVTARSSLKGGRLKWLVIGVMIAGCSTHRPQADLILSNGKIITVDEKFSLAKAVAIRGGKILAVGEEKEIRQYAGDSTRIIDLGGHAVVPGLIEGHAHPIQASQSEYREKIPDLHTINDLLSWIRREAATRKPGEWIVHPKFFFTRLGEMRKPTLRELDSVAPENPVFLNGSFGGMINTQALQRSGMMTLKHPGILRNAKTGQPAGVIRGSAFGLLAIGASEALSESQQLEALRNLFHLYNEVGITSVCSGGGPLVEIKLFEKLKDRGELSVRVFHNVLLEAGRNQTPVTIRNEFKKLGCKTGDGDEWLKVGALKVMVDGGVLTGTAFLREGWGEKAMAVYSIEDPNYRGELFYSKKDLIEFIEIADELGWKFTAHVTGGGGVDTLLAAYESVSRSRPIREKRFSIIHGNFFTPEAIQKMANLGIYADMQPAWYYKDTDLLSEVLGSKRIGTFHPYQSLMKAGVVVNGGSDHMVKWDATTSINPYNPFLAIESVVSRRTERNTVFNPEEAISREQALRMYTINNARASFEENSKGSIEAGKVADLVVLSDDLLSCPEEKIHEIKSILTLVGGKTVFDGHVLSPPKGL